MKRKIYNGEELAPADKVLYDKWDSERKRKKRKAKEVSDPDYQEVELKKAIVRIEKEIAKKESAARQRKEKPKKPRKPYLTKVALERYFNNSTSSMVELDVEKEVQIILASKGERREAIIKKWEAELGIIKV